MVVASTSSVAIDPAALGNVGLDADNWLDPRLARSLVELDRTEHVAVIGERKSRHAGVLRCRDDVVQSVSTVEEAVLAMAMEMNK